MLSPDAVDAVVFDMGGVFVVPHEEPIGAAIAAAGVELELTVELVRAAHYLGVRALTDRLAAGAFRESDTDVWHEYDHAYFGGLGVGADDVAAVIDHRNEQRRDGVKGIWRHRLDHNIAAFSLIASDRPVAIVTNNDGTAVEQCLEYEICQVGPGPLPAVAAIVDSGVVGVAKPDPGIFAPALEALTTEPERTLYVGDTVHADVHGARNATMPVVQLDPLDLHADHDHWRLPDVVALAEHLLGSERPVAEDDDPTGRTSP